MSDDGFHEIQLNGKQLVFLFMAATVVSVVIFLCGVMVGRGVRGDRPETASSDLPAAVSSPAASPSLSPPSAPVPAPKGPTAAPPEPADDGSTMKDLSAENPSDGTLAAKSAAKPQVPAAKPAATAKSGAKPAASEKPAASAAARTPAPAPVPIAAAASPSTVTSGGFAVQITALRDRSEADAIVKRLAGKGYPAYVVNPLPGKPPVYRVQVGRFQERAEADRIASKLQKEEQFSPWVTR